MLVLNNEPLNLVNPKTPTEITAAKKIKVISEQKELIVIKSNKRIQFSDRGRKLPSSDVVIEMKETRTNSETGVMEHWIYCKSPRVKDGKTVYKRDHFKVGNGIMHLSPKRDAEKIYYLKDICNLKAWGLTLEDLEADAAKVLAKDDKESTIKFYITSSQSPLKEKDIRMLAASWGIQNSDTTGLNHLKLQLRDQVIASEKNKKSTNRGVDDFLDEAVNMGIETEVRANVNLAIERKTIINNVKEHEWRYFKPDGVLITKYSAMREDRKKDILYQYFIGNEGEYAELVTELDGEGNVPRMTLEEIKNLPRVTEIRQALKDNYSMTLPIGLTRDGLLEEAERRLGIG